MKIPFDVDTAAVRAAMESLQKGEPAATVQVPEGLTKLAALNAWSHVMNSPQFAPAINAAMCIERRMALITLRSAMAVCPPRHR